MGQNTSAAHKDRSGRPREKETLPQPRDRGASADQDAFKRGTQSRHPGGPHGEGRLQAPGAGGCGTAQGNPLRGLRRAAKLLPAPLESGWDSPIADFTTLPLTVALFLRGSAAAFLRPAAPAALGPARSCRSPGGAFPWPAARRGTGLLGPHAGNHPPHAPRSPRAHPAPPAAPVPAAAARPTCSRSAHRQPTSASSPHFRPGVKPLPSLQSHTSGAVRGLARMRRGRCGGAWAGRHGAVLSGTIRGTD